MRNALLVDHGPRSPLLIHGPSNLQNNQFSTCSKALSLLSHHDNIRKSLI